VNGQCKSRCDPNLCQICDGQGHCISRCDPNKCEACDGQGHCVACSGSPCLSCVNGSCVVCGGDPNFKCCDGECAKKCHTVDGETCSGGPTGNGWSCEGCAMGGYDCGWQEPMRTYKGGTEKICDWDGCASDCHHDEKLCYTDYPCVPANIFVPAMKCGWIPPDCQEWQLDVCYNCMGNESCPQEHWVQNDSCSQ